MKFIKFLPFLLLAAVFSGCGGGETAYAPPVGTAETPVSEERPKEGYYAAYGNGYRWIDSDIQPFSDANLVSRDGNICEVYYYSEDDCLRVEQFRLSENGKMQPVQCLSFDGFDIWAASEDGSSPYEADKNTYYENGGESEIADINEYLAKRDTQLSNGMLVRDTSPDSLAPFFGEKGVYMKEHSGVKYSRDNSRREAYSYIYLTDAAKNRLTEEYDAILPLNERYGLYMCQKNGIYGVLSVKDGEISRVFRDSETPYRCIDLGETAFVFPIGTSGEYFDTEGNKIDDFTALLTENGKSLERAAWADKAIKHALDTGWLPPDLAFDYKNDITRREYCGLVTAALRSIGYPLESSYKTPFFDTDDYNVSAACSLGLIDGKNGKFDPDGKISAEEAEELLDRLSALKTEFGQADINVGDGNFTRQQAVTAVYDIIKG